MTRHTSRRAMLQGAAMLTAIPVAALGGVPHFDVVGEPEPTPPLETPVMRLYRQWEAVLDAQDAAWDTVKGQGSFEDEDAVYEAFAPERHRIEEAMKAEPAADLRDLAAKVVVLSGEGCFSLPDETTLECAALVGRDFDKLPRCLFKEAAA